MSVAKLCENLERICLTYASFTEERQFCHNLLRHARSSNKYYLQEDGCRIVTVEGENKRVIRSFSKWLKYLERKEGIQSPSCAAAISTRWGELFTPRSYTFEVVSGTDIIDAYVNGPISCMSSESHSCRIKFYAENGIELVKIMDETGKYFGRALLWPVTTRRGKVTKMLDRVYPSDRGQHCQAARKWAAEQGFVFRKTDSAGENLVVDGAGTTNNVDFVPVKLDGLENPYFDTFRYAYALENEEAHLIFTNSTPVSKNIIWGGTSTFLYTQESKRAGWITTDIFNTQSFVWEMENTLDGSVHKGNLHRMVEMPDGRLAHPDNFIYCGLSGKKLHCSEMLQYYSDRYAIFVDRNLFVPSQLTVELRNDLLISRSTFVTAGLNEGFYSTNTVTGSDGRIWYAREYQFLLAYGIIGEDYTNRWIEVEIYSEGRCLSCTNNHVNCLPEENFIEGLPVVRVSSRGYRLACGNLEAYKALVRHYRRNNPQIGYADVPNNTNQTTD